MVPIEEITESRFEMEVLESEEPVLVFFYAPDSPDSARTGEVLSPLIGEFSGRLQAVRVNVYREPQLAAAQNVRRVPALLLFQGGIRIGRRIGFREADELRSWLMESLPSTVREEGEGDPGGSTGPG